MVSESATTPVFVPFKRESAIEVKMSPMVRDPAFSPRKCLEFSLSIMSLQQEKNHKGASEVSILAASWPQIILGKLPLSSKLPNNFTMDFASSRRPSSIKALQNIRLSLPQSRNQGYPAITLLSLPRLTRNASRLLYTALKKGIPFTKSFNSKGELGDEKILLHSISLRVGILF